MSRLTKKNSNGYDLVKKGEVYYVWWNDMTEKTVRKLGELEDLMENYGIESVEELELIIKDHKRLYNKEIELSADLGMYQNENDHLIKDIEKYWELEEELGCPLEVLIKPLLDGGIIENDGYGAQLTGLSINGDGSLSLIAINGDHYDLKDYQKTWWLEGEK